MRGGISYIANRHGTANNKYMKEYNEKASSKGVTYLDTNNPPRVGYVSVLTNWRF